MYPLILQSRLIQLTRAPTAANCRRTLASVSWLPSVHPSRGSISPAGRVGVVLPGTSSPLLPSASPSILASFSRTALFPGLLHPTTPRHYYSSNANLRKLTQRLSNTQVALGKFQLTDLYIGTASNTIRNAWRIGVGVFCVTIWAVPFLYFTAQDPVKAAIAAGYASMIPFLMFYAVNRRIVTRMWLVSDRDGQLPRAVRETFASTQFNPRGPLFPQQLVAIEVYPFMRPAKPYVVSIDQLVPRGMHRNRERWEFTCTRDANGRKLPSYIYFHDKSTQVFAELKILKHQVEAIKNKTAVAGPKAARITAPPA
ncbi:hypothetical protein H4R33_002555 [Dimargaris cristalligena]|uniref:Uncharacterized protein n=1 Tax=Dimargaris cristalligena TaxID=215637 RepID=A0A4P9ZN07_9FUNG|nr:hypothetical protein H4R33_002555 [Dimargaris cristalligena]RKP34488.1 hypothetical protein BJ085DRAFT_35876 [Dimargaris cristalligena]|eukprot:RKP34488.1 hypothetical protein BJ085DRAFT_35876 [Dimargaris cristalligena]